LVLDNRVVVAGDKKIIDTAHCCRYTLLKLASN
jgi:hypothetical protein